jgi:hypothetical protein
MRSELIDERHLARRAIIYIRQSSPHQVLTNQESLRLQYDLRRRALDLEWHEEDASNSNWPDRGTGIIVRVEPRHGAAVSNRSGSA